MTLANLIQQYALSQATAGDWVGCAAILNDPTISVPNDHAWTFGELIDSQGIANMQLVAGTIQAAGAADAIMNSAFIALSTTGLRLDSPDRQALIDQLGIAGSWPQTLIDSIKQSGLKMESPSPSVVTAEECEDAWKFHNSPVTSVFQELLLSRNRSRTGTNTVIRTTAVNLVGDFEKSRDESVNMIEGGSVSVAAQACFDAINAAVTTYLGTL
jgi:hypothetical protein